MSGRAHAMHGLYCSCAVYMNLASDLGRPRESGRGNASSLNTITCMTSLPRRALTLPLCSSTPREAEFKQVFHILPTNHVADA